MAFKEYENIDELRKLQRAIASVLFDFVKVCEELDINYFAYGGTCIGAVRHKGFIPWDDDVDVAMLRSDYEKFLREAPALLGDKYRIDNSRTQANYPSPFSYLALVDTVNIPEAFETCEWVRSIGIDIFPLDRVSEVQSTRRRQLRGTWFWGRLGFLRATPRPYLPFDGAKRHLVYFVCGIAHRLLTLFRISPQFIQDMWEKCATLANDEDTRLVADFSDRHPLTWSFTLQEIFPLVDGEFNGREIKLPREWDKLLTRQYGSYMELPPEEQRKNHYPVCLDFGPYSE